MTIRLIFITTISTVLIFTVLLILYKSDLKDPAFAISDIEYHRVYLKKSADPSIMLKIQEQLRKKIYAEQYIKFKLDLDYLVSEVDDIVPR